MVGEQRGSQEGYKNREDLPSLEIRKRFSTNIPPRKRRGELTSLVHFSVPFPPSLANLRGSQAEGRQSS